MKAAKYVLLMLIAGMFILIFDAKKQKQWG